MYREGASRLPGAFVWHRTVPAGVVQQHRILPDGCMDLIWAGGVLLVAGPDTAAYLASGAPGAGYTGLRFAPGTGPTVLGVPAYELCDKRVPLAELWPAAEVRRCSEYVEQAVDRGAALEEVARGRLGEAEPADLGIAEMVASLRAGATVAVTADRVGIGERQLHRRCVTAFGYGAKTLVRILRMNRAVAMARSGAPFANVAAACGYADQAHLAREVKAFAGVSLGTLIR